MRYKTILILLLIAACKPKVQLCLEDLKFIRHQNGLIPPTVTLVFKDEKGIIEKAIKNETFETVFFYSFEKDKRIQGYMTPGRYKGAGDLTELYVGINYFEDPGKRNWSKEKVEDFLTKDEVGLIIGKDTIIAKKCK